MNASEMIDLSLGQVDDDRRDRLERGLETDPEAAFRLAQLRSALNAMLDDGDEIEPPADLAARTFQFVAEQKRRRQRSWIHDLRPVSVPFRWADVAMAAGIFLAGLLTLMPAIQRSRAQWQLVACADNLRSLGSALNRYAASHGHYPAPPSTYPSGSYALILKETGDLPAEAPVSCPCSGECAVHRSLTKYSGLRDLASRRPETLAPEFVGAYAYTAGFQDGGRHSPVPGTASSSVPLLSDQPPHAASGAIHDGNSPNHGGGGQNVLHADGHVGYYHNRFRSRADADIFLNQDRKPGPGLHKDDSVLLPSAFNPLPPLRSNRRERSLSQQVRPMVISERFRVVEEGPCGRG